MKNVLAAVSLWVKRPGREARNWSAFSSTN